MKRTAVQVPQVFECSRLPFLVSAAVSCLCGKVCLCDVCSIQQNYVSLGARVAFSD